MQMLLLENIALTFAEDAYALVIGAGKIVAKFLMRLFISAPIERIARASDVAGCRMRQRQQARKCRCPFSFRHLKQSDVSSIDVDNFCPACSTSLLTCIGKHCLRWRAWIVHWRRLISLT